MQLEAGNLREAYWKKVSSRMPEKTDLDDVPWLTGRGSSGCVSNEVSSCLDAVSCWVNVITIE